LYVFFVIASEKTLISLVAGLGVDGIIIKENTKIYKYRSKIGERLTIGAKDICNTFVTVHQE
jgi:hypothetical protein